MNFGVLAVGLAGAFFARFEPRGMTRALYATALVQAFVPVIALVIWPQVSWGAAGVVGVFMLNAFFVALVGRVGVTVSTGRAPVARDPRRRLGSRQQLRNFVAWEFGCRRKLNGKP
jgi:hypothetical protein